MAIDLVVVAEPAAAADPPPRRRRHRTVIALAVVIVLAVLAAGITELRGRPDLGPGSFYVGGEGTTVLSDGLAATKFEIDGNSGGVLHVSVRNDGRVPVTILGLDPAAQPTMTPLVSIAFEPNVDRPGVSPTSSLPTVSTVTLDPGREAGIELVVRSPACLPAEKGSSLIFAPIPVKVRRLGLTRSTTIRLDLPLWVHYSADHPAVGTCP